MEQSYLPALGKGRGGLFQVVFEYLAVRRRPPVGMDDRAVNQSHAWKHTEWMIACTTGALP
jgi:hypothetical protein